MVVLLAGAMMLGAYMANISINARIDEGRRFNKDKEVPASRAYDRLMSMDPETSYPTSPEGVMDFFNEAFYLMYSNSIIDDGTLFEVMARQRDVYSDDLRVLNPKEIQFAQLKSDLESLYAENSICLAVERKGTVYDESRPGECVVQVMIYYNTFGAIYRNYFLTLDDDGHWRVNAWQTTDESFAIVEQD
jgi:hypothetical protein